jgi:hypothetical protein
MNDKGKKSIDINILKAEYIGFEYSSYNLKKMSEVGLEYFKNLFKKNLIKNNINTKKEIPTFLPPYSKSLSSNENYKKATLVYPLIVNLSFSIELLLKILILQENQKYVNGHEIKILFNKLPQEIKEDVKKNLIIKHNLKSEEFDNILDINNKSFIDWRYSFEKPSPSQYNKVFLFDFRDLLKEKVIW